MKIEPRHDKTHKMICAPSEDSHQPGHPPSLISQCCPPEAKLGPKLAIERTAKDLSLRWAQKSFCWFCHEVAQNATSSESAYAAHLHFITCFTFRIEHNMKSLSHANNIVLRWDNYIDSLN